MSELLDRIEKIYRDGSRISVHFGVAGTLEYIGVFCQSETEFERLDAEVKKMGVIVEPQKTGDIVKLNSPIELCEGSVKYLRARRFDGKCPELGCCDYKVEDWPLMRSKLEGLPGVKILERPNCKLLEMTVPGVFARAYLPTPALSEDYGHL